MKKDVYGECSSCGRSVKGIAPFMGPMYFHCRVPPCWPESLWLADAYYMNEFLDRWKNVNWEKEQ